LSNTPPATDQVSHQPLEAPAVLQEQTCSQEPVGSRDRAGSKEQASQVELIPSLEPCLPSASYSFSLVSVLLRLPHCPP